MEIVTVEGDATVEFRLRSIGRPAKKTQHPKAKADCSDSDTTEDGDSDMLGGLQKLKDEVVTSRGGTDLTQPK